MARPSCKILFCALLCVLAFCVSAIPALAQGYGTISGTISDPTGAVAPNVTVKVTHTQTGREVTVVSNKEGAFVFSALLPSTYTLAASAPGFKSFTQSGIVLQADQALTVNVTLQIGEAKEVVEITGAVPQVDTTTGTLSSVIDESRIVDLPLNGRNAAALITLVAGVVDAANEGNGVNQGNGKTFPAAVVTSSNGTLPNQSNYLLNGGNNVDEMTNVNAPFPFPDAIQEFSVQTSNYNAEYGQSAGAVVNIVTKSGGQKFHGDAFEFLRNSIFNAQPWEASADTLHRHQFGGTIGGPLIVPGISKGKSTTFFFGYQHTLNHSASTGSTTTVPTLAEEGRTGTGYAELGNYCGGKDSANGNIAVTGFDAAGICRNSDGAISSRQIYNPFTNKAYAFNRIPVADMDPASLKFQAAFPTFSGTESAGTIGGLVNYFKPTVNFYNEYIGRVDHQFSSKDQLFGHYYQNYFEQAGVYDPANLASYTSYFNTRYHSALLSETHIFTNNLLNNLTLNYQREIALRGGPPGSQNITDFGVANIWQPSTGPYMAASISGYFGEGSSAFAGWERNNYTLNDDLHWVKGNHNIAIGGHYELSKFDVTNVYQSYGGFTFGAATNKVGSTNYYYQNAYANFLTGWMTGFQQGNYEQVNDRNHFPGLYIQDSWKVNRRLTLNYGVRWEEFAPWAFKNGNLQQFDPNAYANKQTTSLFSTLPAGLLLAGVDPGLPVNGAQNQYDKFMPRFGFAYDVFGDGKTVVRGGAGIFYQNRLPGFFNLNQGANVPNTMSVSLTNPGMGGTAVGGPFSNPYCTGGCGIKGASYINPFPFNLPFSSTQKFPNDILVEQYDPNFHVPVTYAYNLTIERQLNTSMSARIAYVGSQSRHQFVNLELNPQVNTGLKLTDENGRRVYNMAPLVGPCLTQAACTATNYSNIIDAAMIGSANYNGFQATLDKRTRTLYLKANLTWSKTYDDMPQATRVSNTENLNAGESYVYPLYPANAVGIPASAYVSDIKALDRGLSDIDHPLVISLSYHWEIPGVQGNRFLKHLTNGWSVSGLVSHRSGDSMTTWAGQDISKTGLGQDRSVYNGQPMYYSDVTGVTSLCTAGKHCEQWFNPAAFSLPVNSGVGTGYGNVVKGSQRGPGYSNWDASAARSFNLHGEGVKLQFRAEFFNVLNHTELKNPNSTVNASFGTITGTYGPRVGQLALKLIF